MDKLQQYDIVQITDNRHHWYPCLVIVDEIKSWGIQGYLTVPGDKGGDAFIRLVNSVFEKVGHAIVVSS